MPDTEVLALAAREQWILVSHDAGTMPRHFREFGEAGKQSIGVFLIPQSLDVGAAIQEFLPIWLWYRRRRNGTNGRRGRRCDFQNETHTHAG
jgi:hypothetical protein